MIRVYFFIFSLFIILTFSELVVVNCKVLLSFYFELLVDPRVEFIGFFALFSFENFKSYL